MSKIKEEIRRRVPRLTMSLVMAVIFWIISMVVPPTIRGINVPGINSDAGLVAGIIVIVITAVFLIRALSDAVVLADVVADIIVRRMGVKEGRSPKRAGRELIYIIAIILAVTAILPISSSIGGEAGSWLTILIIYIALGMILILIYDIGRTVYKIIEHRVEQLADRLSEMSKQESDG